MPSPAASEVARGRSRIAAHSTAASRPGVKREEVGESAAPTELEAKQPGQDAQIGEHKVKLVEVGEKALMKVATRVVTPEESEDEDEIAKEKRKEKHRGREKGRDDDSQNDKERRRQKAKMSATKSRSSTSPNSSPASEATSPRRQTKERVRVKGKDRSRSTREKALGPTPSFSSFSFPPRGKDATIMRPHILGSPDPVMDRERARDDGQFAKDAVLAHRERDREHARQSEHHRLDRSIRSQKVSIILAGHLVLVGLQATHTLVVGRRCSFSCYLLAVSPCDMEHIP